ncbi:MACPF domain-containing protein At4g24290 isoform X1 [Neltuma alba]|uniref:MACPF domain-containing protein At4g24290 isoform X1 n=2 Tax=Neltuma alba TaxID=207710 RepID=UPI0010A45216|nr:MACPF domain-containing protein At4g24290-like isoform X1 [Prosopis alba]
MSAKALDPKRLAEASIKSIGLGYDLTNDLKLRSCKINSSDPILIAIDKYPARTVELPNGVSFSNVPKSIKCDKGERMRLCSDVLTFQQMSEQFNQELSLSGKIPSGYFNAAFELSEAWQKEAANTKSLAFDGVSITLYNVALEKTQVVLREHVKQAVPSSWDPAALARFIEKFGTHVIVGVKIGGTDIIYARQQFSSSVQPTDVQKKLKEMADKFFVNGAGRYYTNDEKFNQKEKFLKENVLGVTVASSSYYSLEVQDIKFMGRRKGGRRERNLTHAEWCQTVPSQPDVISMSFIPITSLLSGVNGSGFLTHAINLYLRYKPPIEELHQFLEFQLPRQWAPIFGELALGPDRKPQTMASLQFSFMGPKLHVNTTPVDVGEKPVTGLRLYLEGKKSNRLAIHLQHLSSQPQTFLLENDKNGNVLNATLERKYFEKVQWKSFSHVCTAPVEPYEDTSIVTGACFEVRDHGLKKVLYLRLKFAKVIGATSVRAADWDGSPGLTHKSGMISTLISTRFSSAQKPPPSPADVHINSALYPNGPPVPTQAPKLLKFVDTTEITRGPQDSPGYWVVSGARLLVENGKISLKVKYSLLTVIPPDEEGGSY